MTKPNKTKYAPDSTTGKQRQTTQTRHQLAYKQLMVKTNQPSFVLKHRLYVKYLASKDDALLRIKHRVFSDSSLNDSKSFVVVVVVVNCIDKFVLLFVA